MPAARKQTLNVRAQPLAEAGEASSSESAGARGLGVRQIVLSVKEGLIWAPPGWQGRLRVLKQEAGLQSYIRPVVQAAKPAGPDGIR